ncbi:hypothetical protein P3X46_023180 [Hevea brasiliensis]|uniref:Uncharacterized protein n=1 Tax=Hevea brasiliensis TaxID=3981 RepID=A0ABQ9LA61_HEVBR|nr:uncharacterized protein LOC110660688 [Hevea brasiliensis]XP_021674755.2 uncharacterized protein LOC110660688 [Hevea brasiliensis]KAJ9163521.1 hypothetical protein P3X46_023180 [Hevea brasiliensis]
MGPSEPEAKQTSLVMGSEHQSETSDGLKINPASNSSEENHTAHEKRLSSASSSSSCSSFEDPGFSPSETALNTGSATQSPPTQLMERPTETATSSSYRIPSSVFASKPSGPNDWSVASSESLFSIHMGNMSFTKDQANWFGKSGELGLVGDLTLSGPLSPMVDFSSKRHPSHQSPNKKSGETERLSEAKAAEAMREIVSENEADATKHNSTAKIAHQSASLRRSDVSGASGKSFAFPILTGDHKTDSSQKRNATSPVNSQPHTPKVSQDPDSSQQKSQPGTPNPEPAPKAPPNAAQGKWYSCLPCCSSCS